MAPDALTTTESAITLIDQLASLGLRRVVICPGSRSTPLSLAAEAHPDITTRVGIDERGAAFFALGMAKASKWPVAIITTSGTAVANLLPAIIEAHQSNIPLIALTADRPAKMRNTGTNQTIDQVGIFSHYVRQEEDLPPPPASAPHLIAQAWTKCTEFPAGPIHINQQFAKPLEPDPEGQARLDALTARAPRPDPRPTPIIESDDIPEIDPTVLGPRGLIIAGPGCGLDAHRLDHIAKELHVPILADCLSGLRAKQTLTVQGFDAYIDAPAILEGCRPDWIVQFGMTPTSAALGRFLSHHADVPRYRVDASGRKWNDIAGDVTMLTCPPDLMLEAIARGRPGDPKWHRMWHAMDEHAFAAVGPTDRVEAGWVAPIVAAAPTLFVGNSMPVRDLERFGADGVGPVYANRGASGIDGTIATAAGIAEIEGPTIAVVGDVAFQHDIGSLAWLHPRIRLVVIDNGGGRIFQHLPIAGATRMFDRLFLTKPTVDIVAAAKAFGLATTAIRPGSIAKAMREKWNVIVVRVPGQASVEWRQRLHATIQEEVSMVMASAQAS